MIDSTDYILILTNGMFLCMCIERLFAVSKASLAKEITPWRRSLYRLLALIMLFMTIQNIYNIIVDGFINNPSYVLTSGKRIIETLSVAAAAVTAHALVRHTTPVPGVFITNFVPFTILLILHFATGWQIIYDIVEYYAIFFGIITLVWASIDLARYNKMIRRNYSDIEGYDLHWLNYIIFTMVILLVIWNMSRMMGGYLANIIYNISATAIWYYITVQVLNYREAVEIGDLNDSLDEPDINSMDYKDQYEIDIIGIKIETTCKKPNILSNNELTVGDLAKATSMKRKDLIEYFDKIDTTFYAFINLIRLEYAVDRLTNSYDSLIDIAKHAGYKNPKAFNLAFETKYGVSPNRYREVHHEI